MVHCKRWKTPKVTGNGRIGKVAEGREEKGKKAGVMGASVLSVEVRYCFFSEALVWDLRTLGDHW